MKHLLVLKELQEKLDVFTELSGLCYKYVSGQFNTQIEIETLSENFSGAIEKVAAYGFCNIYTLKEDIEISLLQLQNPVFKNVLSIYHYLGVSLSCMKINDFRFQGILKKLFEVSPLQNKFLISKIFPEFEPALIDCLQGQTNTSGCASIIKSALGIDDKPLDLATYEYDHDLPLLLMIDSFISNRQMKYERLKDSLLDDILYCVREVQSKHRVYNNNEDQFNSVIQSILAKDYKVESQSQRGVSTSGSTFGELDLKIFSIEDHFPIAIIEAFIISSIQTEYISIHLKKLTVNYDPNGLSRNYAIIYSKNSHFQKFWNRYLEFVSSYSYRYPLVTSGVQDVSNQFPQFSNIRVGLGIHDNHGQAIEVYHLFLNMRFS